MRIFFILLIQYLTIVGLGQEKLPLHKELKKDSTTRVVNDNNKMVPFSEIGKPNIRQIVIESVPKKEFDSIKSAVFGSVASKIKLITGAKFFNADAVNAEMNYNYLSDTSSSDGNDYTSPGLLQYDLDGAFSITSIPFDISYSRNSGYYSSASSSISDYFKANLDVERYRSFLQKQVLKKLSPDLILSTITNRIQEIKRQYERRLMEKVNSIKSDYFHQFKEAVEFPVDIGDISKYNLSNLRDEVFEQDVIDRYNENKARYHEIVSSKRLYTTFDSLFVNQLLKNVKKHEALENIYSKVRDAKESFESNKTVKELKAHLPFTPQTYAGYLKNPGNLRKVIDEYANISFIQNIFLKLAKLDLGQNPVQNGEFSIKGLMNTGINAVFQTERANFGFIGGKNNNVNTWLHSGLNNFVSNEYSGLAGITIGGENSTGQSVSLNFYNFSRNLLSPAESGMQPLYVSSAKRNDVVLTYHKGLKFGSNHEINVDVSKSFGSYTNDESHDSSRSNKGMMASLMNNTGKKNYAVSVDYNGELFKTRLLMSVRKIGLGYNNPGNNVLRRGESQMQMSLLRKFAKNKVTLNYNLDYRHQNFDLNGSYKYVTFTNKVQLKLRLKKSNRVGFSYQQSNYKYLRISEPTTNSFSTIMQANGTYKFVFLNRSVINSISLSKQSMKLPLSSGKLYASNSLLLTHTSTIVLDNNVFMYSLTGNYSNKTDYYYTTSFYNSEASYSYKVLRVMVLTSGTGFYINNGWNNQIGFKQQASLTVLKRIDADIGVDCKLATRVVRPEFSNQVYINSSVRYRF